ncbi:MAG: T9SS type A sorting domain-containing protein [Bacteroidales bacterium]|nr:T9SS type A sorting domain-containing protein [Bacteroidales bacterium]
MAKSFKILISLIIAVGNIEVYSQPWLYHYRNTFKNTAEEPLFTEQKVAFESYWEGREINKGKGYKQFRRWEFLMVPRLAGGNEKLNSLELWDNITVQAVTPPGDSVIWKFSGPHKTPYHIGTTALSGNGRLNCVAFHPADSNIIYAGAPSGGFWVTYNQGQSWATTTDMLDAIGISDIAVSHANPSVIFIATGDGDASDTYAIGILKSVDGGQTWQPTSLSLQVTENVFFRRIIMSPLNANIMLATASNGIYRTTDGWQTYSLVMAGNFRDIEFKPGDPNYVYATTFSRSGAARIFRSTNGGVSFLETVAGLNFNNRVERIELAVTRANAAVVYALASDVSNSGLYAVYRSKNSGESWSLMFNNQSENLLGATADGSDVGGQGWYDLALAVSPVNADLVFAGGVNIWKSVNGGVSWTISSVWYHSQRIKYVHADQHMMAFSPHSKTLFTANDGGLYLTYDDGKNWKDISSNLQILQVYRLGTSKLNNNRIVCGNQDNGTFLFNNNEWVEILGGDGMECHFDAGNDNIIYASVYNGSIYKSTDGGLTFTSIKPSPELKGAWITPLVADRQNPSVIYAAYKDVYRSLNAGTSWEKLSTNLCPAEITSLVVAPSDNMHIYAASGFNIYKTGNGGSNWNEISQGLPGLYITSVIVSPNDPNKIWVSMSGYNQGQKVYYSANGGSNWLNYSAGLPNLPVNNLVIRYNSDSEIYAATDNGVFYRNACLDQWVGFSNGLPKVIVNELEITGQGNLLRAATYGRGIWEAVLPPPLESKAAFKTDIARGCTNAPFTLTYTGTYGFDSLVWVHNASEIAYQSPLRDTIIVSYSTPGKRSFQLKHYSDSIETSEIKYEYLDVSNQLEINISPDKFFLCDSSSVQVFVPPGYACTWSPQDGIDSVSGDYVYINPGEDIVYELTAMHGSCISTNEIAIKYMPDKICSAMLLTAGSHGIFSNICATIEEGEPLPGAGTGLNSGCISQDGWCEGEAFIENSLWFKIIVPVSGYLRVLTRGFDSQIALYKAEYCQSLLGQGSYSILAANDDISTTNYNSQVELSNGLIPGDTLYLQVDGSYGGIAGEFFIDVFDGPSKLTAPVIDPAAQILLYPNPANGQIILQMQAFDKMYFRVDFIDETGKTVFSASLESSTGIFEKHIDIHSLKGFYLVRISSDNFVVYRKVIIN